MIRPTPRLVLLAAAGLVVALLPAVVDSRLWPLWAVAAGITFVAAGLDALTALPVDRLDVRVDVPGSLFIGAGDQRLAVRLDATGAARGARVELVADLGELLAPQPAASVEVAAGAVAVAEVPLEALRRGTATVDAVWLRYAGPAGLMRRTVRIDVSAEVPVVPNTRAVRAAAIRFFRSRDAFAGLKTERYVGEGSEFDSLRDYVPGLDHRALDWKASARHTRLVVRDYRAERNHQVVLAYDTGHLMCERLQGVPKLDHAIHSGLHLSLACLRTGDRVGLFAFDEKVRLFAEPRGGVTAFPRHQLLTSKLEYSTGETNFTLGLMTLAGRLHRRTLVVVFTDFVDSVTVELMVENLQRLARRHLVLCVTLRDEELGTVADARPETLVDLNRAVAAGAILREREVVLRRLRRLGMHVIDAPARAVTSSLIDRYLEIKRRELV